MPSAQIYTDASVAAIREVVNMAYDHVEVLRRAKAQDEGVEYVPNPRPVDMYSAEDCTDALQRLLVEKQRVENWRSAGDTEVSAEAIFRLAPMFEKFQIRIAVGAQEKSLTVSRMRFVGNPNVRP